MDIADLVLILMAGVMASLSPCSFPLLPGYISYYIGASPSLMKTIPSVVACTLGLITIFSLIGLICSLAGSVLYHYFPFMPIVAGIIIILMAFSMIFEVEIKLPLKFINVDKRKGIIGIFIYGMIYGLAASSCSVPVFLSIIIYAIGLGSLYGVMAFVVYALGMSIPIAIIAFLASKAKMLLLKKYSKSIKVIQKIGAGVLLLIGLYLILRLFL